MRLRQTDGQADGQARSELMGIKYYPNHIG